MTNQATVEHFYGNGIDARLGCDAEMCMLDIAVDRELLDDARPQIRLEVLLQPADPKSGVPYGLPLKLLNETVQLRFSRSRQRAHGRSWLPGIPPAVAPNCYYRILTDGR